MKLTTTAYEATVEVRGTRKLTTTIEKTPEGVAKMSLKNFHMESTSDVVFLSDIADFLEDLASEHPKEFSKVTLTISEGNHYSVAMRDLGQMTGYDIAFAIAEKIQLTQLIMG